MHKGITIIASNRGNSVHTAVGDIEINRDWRCCAVQICTCKWRKKIDNQMLCCMYVLPLLPVAEGILYVLLSVTSRSVMTGGAVLSVHAHVEKRQLIKCSAACRYILATSGRGNSVCSAVSDINISRDRIRRCCTRTNGRFICALAIV